MKKITNKNLNQEITWLLNEKYSGQMTKRAQRDIERLRAGEPVDYVIGYKKFCGCKIDLRYKPLIPREETEFWIKKGLDIFFQEMRGCPSGQPRSDAWQNFAEAYRAILPAYAPEKKYSAPSLRILDVFAGSGCCGIAVLKHLPGAKCDFCDIDPQMIRQIRLNLRKNRISDKRYRVFQSDIFSKIKKKYDIILTNPPYIAFGQKNKVQKSVLGFEPKKALFAKNQGLYFIEKFLSQAKNHLAEGGVIYLEFGYNQKKAIEKLLKKFGYQNFAFHRDQFAKYRFLAASV